LRASAGVDDEGARQAGEFACDNFVMAFGIFEIDARALGGGAFFYVEDADEVFI